MEGTRADFTGMTPVQSHEAHSYKGSVFDLMLCCHLLETLNNFFKKGSPFLFCTGPANYVAGLGWHALKGREFYGTWGENGHWLVFRSS